MVRFLFFCRCISFRGFRLHPPTQGTQSLDRWQELGHHLDISQICEHSAQKKTQGLELDCWHTSLNYFRWTWSNVCVCNVYVEKGRSDCFPLFFYASKKKGFYAYVCLCQQTARQIHTHTYTGKAKNRIYQMIDGFLRANTQQRCQSNDSLGFNV